MSVVYYISAKCYHDVEDVDSIKLREVDLDLGLLLCMKVICR